MSTSKIFKLTKKQVTAVHMMNGAARNLMFYGGARSGKTAAVIFAFINKALKYPGSRWLILRYHLSDARTKIAMDTLPKIGKLLSPRVASMFSDGFNKTDMYIKLPNGSEVWFGGTSDPKRAEKILGSEFAGIFIDEVNQIDFATVETVKTRLTQVVPGLKRKMIYALNPTVKSHWCYILFVKNLNPIDQTPVQPSNYQFLQMNPLDNAQNLDEDVFLSLSEMSASKRLRFEKGEWADEIDGALWKLAYIEKNRAPPPTNFEKFDRIVIGVDPAVTNDKKSDETGIIVAGKIDNVGYVLEDCSGRYTPDGWAKIVKRLFDFYKADRIVVEVNQGGDLVEQNLRNRVQNYPITKIRAKKGKITRAEPIVALYERNLVKHCGVFNELESQMVGWTIDDSTSPDRIDALVYTMYSLLIKDRMSFTMVY